MSQARHTIEQLLSQGTLPITHADQAATLLQVYPNRQRWLTFFDKALLIIGVVALCLSVVFFIAYNWLYMGKMGKFVLVEGAMVVTIVGYAWLVYTRRAPLFQQLLLLIASILTGSLLALFGQVYQTGADTWQLFFNWALLIIPWVMIARLPALWLLFLGLLNFATLTYLNITAWHFVDYHTIQIIDIGALTLLNLIAFCAWIICFDTRHRSIQSIPQTVTQSLKSLSNPTLSTTSSPKSLSTSHPTTNPDVQHLDGKDASPCAHQAKTIHTQTSRASHHWSTYIIAVVSTFYISRLAMITVLEDADTTMSVMAILIWLGWAGAIYWYFRTRVVDLFMLTCLCCSVIAVILVWVTDVVIDYSDLGGLILLFILVLAMSSIAIAWLRRVAHSSEGAQNV